MLLAKPREHDWYPFVFSDSLYMTSIFLHQNYTTPSYQFISMFYTAFIASDDVVLESLHIQQVRSNIKKVIKLYHPIGRSKHC
jgi:hypothetical protein